MLAAHRRSAPDDAIGEDHIDQCRFQHAFDQASVPCAAFQSPPFVAATSYGKPLGTHIACARLRAGESGRNQFYPRCALGGDRERLRWVANVGPGTVEVARSLQAEFERVASRYRPRLIAAKANLLNAPPPRPGESRDALAALIRDFLAEVEAFINQNTARISQTGFSPESLTAMATHGLLEWQGDRRLDLPSIDEEWIGQTAPSVELAGSEVLDASGLTEGARTGLSSAQIDDLVVAVNEVATNSIAHGGGAGVARIWREAEAIVCEISDAGVIIDPLVDRTRPSGATADARGFWTVNSLCDLVQVRSSSESGSVVRMRMQPMHRDEAA